MHPEELEQAQNEIAALQRRLTEYAAEVERLRGAMWSLNTKLMQSPSAYSFPAELSEHLCQLQREVGKSLSPPESPTEQGKPDCYVDANDKSTLNALEECRSEREKLREGGKQIAEALGEAYHRPSFLCAATEIRFRVEQALSKARELGLLEKEE